MAEESTMSNVFPRGGRMSRGVVREMLAEFLGTTVLLVFGLGVVAQTVLSHQTAGSMLSINISWGIAVAMGCYVSAGGTGAHLNPAVTIALAGHRRFPWAQVAPHAGAQMAGGFGGAGAGFAAYPEAPPAVD